MTDRRNALLRRAILALLLAGLIAAGLAAATRHGQRTRLMQAEADDILRDPELTRAAERIGRPLFQRHCATCHGDTMHGDPAIGAPDLTDGDWLYGEGRPSELEQTILYGIRAGDPKTRNLADMPAFAYAKPYAKYAIGPLSPDEIADVVAFLGRKAGRPEEAHAAVRGAFIYAHKGGCFDCHGEDGGGDPAIGAPDLLDAVELYGDGSDASLARTIREGRAGVCPGWIGRLGAVEVRALAVTIASRSRAGIPKGRT